ncbi:MAG: hypothetical protein C4567_08120 [Deltaproteobacteria bacterium]|nr:MAG: hypothetical protein C4567_08120 [Deltaproteobacteria bacterium]
MKPFNLPCLLLLPALLLCGCAAGTESQSDAERQAFFAAAQQANLQGLTCMNPRQYVDLSGYAPYLGVKYPPTQSVEVLTKPPSKPHQAFAFLQCAGPAAVQPSGTLEPAVLSELTKQAKAIGADAIIVRSGRDHTNQTNGGADKVEAVAIKYRLENLEKKRESLGPNLK